MSTLLMLAGVGMVEAVVWLFRMRTSMATSVWASTLAGFLVCLTRIGFVMIGVSAMMANLPWWQVVGAYAVPATAATAAAHWWTELKDQALKSTIRWCGLGLANTAVCWLQVIWPSKDQSWADRFPITLVGMSATDWILVACGGGSLAVSLFYAFLAVAMARHIRKGKAQQGSKHHV